MTKDYVFSRIDNYIENNNMVRVHFKTFKAPKFGMFVNIEDSEELRTKGFIRFVSSGQLDAFKAAEPRNKRAFTLLLMVSDITELIPYVCQVII